MDFLARPCHADLARQYSADRIGAFPNAAPQVDAGPKPQLIIEYHVAPGQQFRLFLRKSPMT